MVGNCSNHDCLWQTGNNTCLVFTGIKDINKYCDKYIGDKKMDNKLEVGMEVVDILTGEIYTVNRNGNGKRYPMLVSVVGSITSDGRMSVEHTTPRFYPVGTEVKIIPPKKKVMMSRYRFEYTLTGNTHEPSGYYTDKGLSSKCHGKSTYFDDVNYKRTKIGEEIPCPWEQ